MKTQILHIGVNLLIIISINFNISNANIDASSNAVILSIADNRYDWIGYDHCCWAAICQTVLQYYKVYKSQGEIIKWASDSQDVINYTCNHDNPKSVDKILDHYANIPIQSDSCADNYVDINKIKSEIDHDRPIVILFKYWDGAPINGFEEEGLFSIIHGYNPTSPLYHIYWQDPYPLNVSNGGGYRYSRYDSLTSCLLYHDDELHCDIYQKWKGTLTLGGSNTNPSGPNPPFNPANQNTISQRVIPAAITTIFQTILKRVP